MSISLDLATLSDLLAAKPVVERSPFAETNGVQAPLGLLSAKEKEYQTKLQHLTDLLNESEANHQRLLDQAKVNITFSFFSYRTKILMDTDNGIRF